MDKTYPSLDALGRKVKETYGFKSSKNPPPVEELKDFEDDMLKMIQFVKFKQVNNPFLNKLKENTDRIKNEPKLLIAADKTTNFYKLEPSTYNDLLEKNMTKSYKKALPRRPKQSIGKTKTKLGIDDRVETTARRDAFITLKDHKTKLRKQTDLQTHQPHKSPKYEKSAKRSSTASTAQSRKTPLTPMEKHRSRNRLVQVYQKQRTLQFHLFRHRRVLSVHQPGPPNQSTRLRLRL